MIAVVVIDPSHEFAPDKRESMVDRGCCPGIFRKTNDIEARIDIAPENLCGPIARSIVDHDDLKRKPALQPANAVQAFPKIALAIKHIDDDRDEGMPHGLSAVGHRC